MSPPYSVNIKFVLSSVCSLGTVSHFFGHEGGENPSFVVSEDALKLQFDGHRGALQN
jgi:hypothetical protein